MTRAEKIVTASVGRVPSYCHGTSIMVSRIIVWHALMEKSAAQASYLLESYAMEDVNTVAAGQATAGYRYSAQITQCCLDSGSRRTLRGLRSIT